MNSIISFGDLVDQLLSIKASIAELEQKEKELKDCLIATGQSSIEGMLARAIVSYCDGRAKVDWESIAHKLGTPSRQLITAHTTYGQAFHVVRVSARKGSK
jgi:hypothetical protein